MRNNACHTTLMNRMLVCDPCSLDSAQDQRSRSVSSFYLDIRRISAPCWSLRIQPTISHAAQHKQRTCGPSSQLQHLQTSRRMSHTKSMYVHMRALTNYTTPPTGEWGSSRENKTSNTRHMTRTSPLPKRSPPQRVGQAVARNLDAWNPIPAMTNVRPDPLLLGPQQV